MNNRNLDAMYHCFVLITLVIGGLLVSLVAHAIIESFFGMNNEQLIKQIVTFLIVIVGIWYITNKVYKK